MNIRTVSGACHVTDTKTINARHVNDKYESNHTTVIQPIVVTLLTVNL